jgi:putative membrane protein
MLNLSGRLERKMKYWKIATVSATLLMALGAGTAAHAADLSRGDKKFMEKAAQAGMFEIEASKLATANAGSADVKSFATMMVTDHTAVAQELKTLADSKGVTLPADLPRGEKATIKDLQADKDAKFDKLYTDKVAVSAHQDAVKLFTGEVKDAKDPDVKAFAEKTLPALKAHLDKGMALRKSMAANGKSGGAMRSTAPAPVPSPASPAAPANVAPNAPPAR